MQGLREMIGNEVLKNPLLLAVGQASRLSMSRRLISRLFYHMGQVLRTFIRYDRVPHSVRRTLCAA